ncbi:Protein with similarity to mammalian ELMO [Branchiostoma belcheri]|nr:Protein with similarity to mammalian ELMO [Branchiostoma belcheri]
MCVLVHAAVLSRSCMQNHPLKHHRVPLGLLLGAGEPSPRMEQPSESVVRHGCAGCKKKIKDRYLLKALDQFWHEDCLKCACCECRLGEVGSTLFTKANLILCRRDYLRLFGTTGSCAVCSKIIPAFEIVMRAGNNVYHLDCFACQRCNHRFCVGDKFFLCENTILCQLDYQDGPLPLAEPVQTGPRHSSPSATPYSSPV